MAIENNTAHLLVQEIEEKQLLVELIGQVNKDFRLSGLPFRLAEKAGAMEVVSKLRSILFNMMTNNFGDYLNLLYRVDVSEKKIKALKEIDPEKIANAVTQMVLEREWQKVWFKNKSRLRD